MNRNHKDSTRTLLKNPLLEKAKHITELIHRRFATRLEKWTAGFSRQKWVIILVLFIVLATTSTVWNAARTFRSHSDTVAVTRMKSLPRNGKRSEHPTRGPELKRIAAFQRHLDSLLRSPSGKQQYDSIARLRPGLLDSLRMVRDYYKN